MNQIELKRIYKIEDYDDSEIIIEFKLLSALQESDKEELTIFINKELINKKLINEGVGCLEFDINLEEINSNINKITNIKKLVSNDDCNRELDCIEYDKSKLFVICGHKEVIFDADSYTAHKFELNPYNYTNTLKTAFFGVDNSALSQHINIKIKKISVVNEVIRVSNKSKRKFYASDIIVDYSCNKVADSSFDKDEIINFERRYDSGDSNKLANIMYFWELFKDDIVNLVEPNVILNLDLINYNLPKFRWGSCEKNQVRFRMENNNDDFFKEISIISKDTNEILIAKKEEEINKLQKEIAILKKDIDK